jgi:hypothetical protein
VQYMVDIETLGTNPGCVILAIGACTLDETRKFEAIISIENCEANGLLVEQATEDWWNEQPAQVRSKMFGGTMLLQEALKSLSEFISEPTEVWANGSPFDFPILRAAYQRCAIAPSWRYHQEFDMRTLRRILGKAFPARTVDPSLPAHDALSDAIIQARATRKALGMIIVGSKVAADFNVRYPTST